MADLIEIGIEVRSGSVKSATREVDQLGNSVKSAQRSASAFVAEFEKQERQLNRVVKANQRYADTARQAAADSQAFYKSLQQVNLANKSAANSADVFSKRIEQLKQKYNPLYATSKQYEVMLNEINEAHLVGALNLQQFEAAQERLNQEFTQGTGAFARYQKQFSRGFNQMGVISQQVGYQVGDFLVQVQSGTNPMVAFGQQATQLLGVLYLLPAPIMASTVAIGALRISVTTLIASVSIILPLLTAIGAYFLRSRDAAVELDKETNTLSSTISKLNTVQKTTADGFEEGLNKAFDSSANAVGRLLSALKEAEFRAAMQPVEDALDAMTVGVDKVDIALKSIVELNRLEKAGTALSRQQEGLREDSQKLIEQNLLLALSYEDINSALDAIGESKTTKELVTNFAEALALAETFSGPIGKELKDALVAAADEADILEEIIRFSAESAKELNDELEDVDARLKRIKGLMAEVAAEATVVKDETVKLTEAFGASTQEVIAIQRALDDGKISATQLKGVDIDAALSPAAKSARKLAEDLGISLRTALAMVGLARESKTVLDPRDPRYNEDEARLQKLKDMIESGELYNSTLDETTKKTKTNTAATKDNRTAYEKAMMTAKEFADALDQQVLGAVDGVADAFSDFLQRGMKDFKSFVGSIKDMFIRLLADMAAMAIKRQILIPIAAGFAGGFGSAAAGATTANLVAGGGMAGSLAAGASSFASGAMAGVQGFAGGGISGYAATLSATAANAGVMATIGAAVPAIAAVAAIASLFGGGKPLVSAENMQRFNDALVMTGQEIEATGHEAVVTAKALADVAGGFKELSEKTKFFYENFYTEGERRADSAAKATDQLNKAFAELEMAIPQTHAEFRQLIEAQDLMTEGGRETYNALLDVSGAFVTLNGTIQQVSENAKALRQQELALRAARDSAKLDPFIGEEGTSALLERFSSRVFSGNIDDLVDEAYQEIFEALTPDATQQRAIRPWLEELRESLVGMAEELSLFDELTRKYSGVSREIINLRTEFGRFIRQTRNLYGTDLNLVGIARGIEATSKAFKEITRVSKQAVKDLNSLFVGVAAEFKEENTLDQARSLTSVIDANLNVFRNTASELQRFYREASETLSKLSTEVLKTGDPTGQLRYALMGARRAGQEAAAELGRLNTIINTLGTANVAFEQAVADKLVEPIKDALTVYLPNSLSDLSGDVRNTVQGLLAVITEGGVGAFQSGFAQLSQLFTSGQITVDQFNNSFSVMEEVFRGNISLTEEYTTKQQTVIEKLSNAYQDFTSKLENSISVVQGGIQSLIGQLTGADTGATRRGSISYLRSVARTGQYDAGRLEAAVGAATSVEAAGFGSRRDFIRYVADTTALLRTVEGTLSGQLETLEMQQVKAILNIQDTNQSAATSLQSIQSLIAEFLGVGGRIPSFATGGYHSGGLRIVGENGPELEATGPSRIIPAGQFSMGGDAELRREVAELRVDLKAALVQIAKNTRKSSDTLNKFDYQGLPDSRGY